MSDKEVLITLMLANALKAVDDELPIDRAKRIKACAENQLNKNISLAMRETCLKIINENDPISVCIAMERSTANFLNK